MQTLNKTEQIASLQGKNHLERRNAIYVEPEPQTTEKDDIIDGRDAEYKQRMKQQREGRKTRENNLLLGDYVLVRQPKRNKWSTPYEPVFYAVCSIQGSQITARRVTD